MFVNDREKKDFKKMTKNINSQNNVEASDTLRMVENLWENRARFSSKVSATQMLMHGWQGRLFRKLCCCCCAAFTLKKNKKLDNLVRNAE